MIAVKAVKLLEADAERGAVTAGRVYTSHEGLECKEIHHVQKEGDYTRSCPSGVTLVSVTVTS